MKKTLLNIFIFGAAFSGLSQTPVQDAVITGQGYVNECWYQLASGDKATANALNWDLAFSTDPFGNIGTSIRFNHLKGDLYYIPGVNTADFETVDTTGMVANGKLYNSEADWGRGAFNSMSATSNVDYGWAEYNTVTHTLSASKIFVAKIDGAYYKIMVDMNPLPASRTYKIKYAKLGETSSEKVISYGQYTSRNFIYFNLLNGEIENREPAGNDWDLFFGKYDAIVLPGRHYPTAGVLSNLGVEVALVNQTNAATYNYQGNEAFSEDANIIGWTNWKETGQGGSSVSDTTVYFVKDRAGAIWKLLFTEFVSGTGTGADAGKYGFEKTLVSGLGIKEQEKSLLAEIYPNPANESVTIVIDNTTQTSIALYDVTGKMIKQVSSGETGLHTVHINVESLNAGMYQILITEKGKSVARKLIVSH